MPFGPRQQLFARRPSSAALVTFDPSHGTGVDWHPAWSRLELTVAEEPMHLTPFLLFDGNCAEAMAFYQACLGGELIVTKVGDTPMKDQFPSEQHSKVTYAQLKSGSMEFSATDWLHQTRRPKPGNTVAMYLNRGTYEQLREVFDKLSVGADPDLLDDLRDLPFGTYGHLADRYGVHWFFRGDSSTPPL